MALLQTGYLGNVGPVFVEPTLVPGKVVIIQGSFENGVGILRVKAPAYADNLRSLGVFDYTVNDCSIGNYVDEQSYQVAMPLYKAPSYGKQFDGYLKIAEGWVNYPTQSPDTPPASSPWVTPNPVDNPVVVSQPVVTAAATSTASGSKINPVVFLLAVVVVVVILNAQGDN